MIGTIWECVVLVAVLAVAACWVLAAARPVPAATGDPGLAPHLARLAGRPPAARRGSGDRVATPAGFGETGHQRLHDSGAREGSGFSFT